MSAECWLMYIEIFIPFSTRKYTVAQVKKNKLKHIYRDGKTYHLRY